MLKEIKALPPFLRNRIIATAAVLIVVCIGLTFLVVHFSNLFSLGKVWGWVITLIIWSWMTVVTNKLSSIFLRNAFVRWAMKADEQN